MNRTIKIGFFSVAFLGLLAIATQFALAYKNQKNLEQKLVETAVVLDSQKTISTQAVQKPAEVKLVEQDNELEVRFFGDMMLDRNVARKMSTSGLEYLFPVPDYIGPDLNIANLEGPFAPKRIVTKKEIAFRFDPDLAAELKQYNFTAFNLANNHSYDMGRANVEFTRKTLEQNELGFFGDELQEGSKFTWVTSTRVGKIAFIGLHNTYRNIDLKTTALVLAEAREAADYVFVNIHWGVEYRATSTKKQQELGHWLIDNGADAVIGHHPHVVEEFEIYNDKPIFYSLGNFVFDQYFSKPTQESMAVKFVLNNDKILRFEIIPLYGVASKVYSMGEAEKTDFFANLLKVSRLNGKIFENGGITF